MEAYAELDRDDGAGDERSQQGNDRAGGCIEHEGYQPAPDKLEHHRRDQASAGAGHPCGEDVCAISVVLAGNAVGFGLISGRKLHSAANSWKKIGNVPMAPSTPSASPM
jgi:hypothetical protein